MLPRNSAVDDELFQQRLSQDETQTPKTRAPKSPGQRETQEERELPGQSFTLMPLPPLPLPWPPTLFLPPALLPLFLFFFPPTPRPSFPPALLFPPFDFFLLAFDPDFLLPFFTAAFLLLPPPPFLLPPLLTGGWFPPGEGPVALDSPGTRWRQRKNHDKLQMKFGTWATGWLFVQVNNVTWTRWCLGTGRAAV